MVNLESARVGIGDGTYAAYVVIPSTFSNSVVSLNTIPTQVKIEYAMNTNLEEGIREQTIYDIVDFEHQLNSGMSYMYISTILSEFHEVQDNSKTIMDNDERDTNILLAITPTDLTELVSIPELSKVDNSVSPLEVTSYNNKNQEDIASINNSYTYYISLSEPDVALLKEQGNDLIEQWTTMEDTIANINITTDADGNIVYEAGVANVVAALTDYNTITLDAKETEIETTLSDIKTEIDNRAADLTSLITAYNNNLNTNKTTIATEIQMAFGTSVTPAIEFDGTAITVDGTAVPISYAGGDEAQISVQMALLSSYLTDIQSMIASSSDTTLQTNYNDYLSGNSDLTAMLGSLQGGTNIFAVDQAALAANMQNAVSIAAANRIPSVSDIETIITNYVPSFSDTLNKGTENETTLTALLEAASGNIQKDLDQKKTQKLPRMDTATITSGINNDIVNPLVTQTDTMKNGLITQYGNEKTSLNTYHSALTAYNPLKYIDNAAIQDYMSDMQINNTAIQTTVAQNYTDNMTFVGEVYKNAELNTTTLGKSITRDM